MSCFSYIDTFLYLNNYRLKYSVSVFQNYYGTNVPTKRKNIK